MAPVVVPLDVVATVEVLDADRLAPHGLHAAVNEPPGAVHRDVRLQHPLVRPDVPVPRVDEDDVPRTYVAAGLFEVVCGVTVVDVPSVHVQDNRLAEQARDVDSLE